MYTVTTLEKIKIWDDNSRDSTKYKFIFNTNSQGKLVSLIVEVEELLQKEPIYSVVSIADQDFVDRHIENFENIFIERRQIAGHLYLLIEEYLQSKGRSFKEQRIRPNQKCQIKVLEDGEIKLLDMGDSEITLASILEERNS